ncbi:hypothetical protein RSAG8_11511, partial [Rhizoctonia solani AG-8 WAC10335]
MPINHPLRYSTSSETSLIGITDLPYLGRIGMMEPITSRASTHRKSGCAHHTRLGAHTRTRELSDDIRRACGQNE